MVTNVMPSAAKERADEVLDKLQIMDPDERDLYKGAASWFNALPEAAKKDVVDGPSLEVAVDAWRSDNGESRNLKPTARIRPMQTVDQARRVDFLRAVPISASRASAELPYVESSNPFSHQPQPRSLPPQPRSLDPREQEEVHDPQLHRQACSPCGRPACLLSPVSCAGPLPYPTPPPPPCSACG